MIPETPRARLLKVQDEVNSLFTDILHSREHFGDGRYVAEALVSVREVLKKVDYAITRVGRI